MTNGRPKISVCSSCYNEMGNIEEWYSRVVQVFSRHPAYDYEIVIADNCSTDGTRELLRRLAAADKRFKVIFNSNNFGQLRSPVNAFLRSTGDASVLMVSDLQDPPELISQMLQKREEGFLVVVATRTARAEGPLIGACRWLYYWLLAKISDPSRIIRNFTGFGLYDRRFVDALRRYNDPVPYLRGLVGEIGFKRATVEFVMGERKRGASKNNVFILYDYAMNGFVNHSKLPLRLAVLAGFCLSGVSLALSLIYFVYKLLYWETFSLGVAPAVIGLFFFSGVQLAFTGVVGEYVGAILTQTKNFPMVIEEETLNFDA